MECTVRYVKQHSHRVTFNRRREGVVHATDVHASPEVGRRRRGLRRAQVENACRLGRLGLLPPLPAGTRSAHSNSCRSLVSPLARLGRRGSLCVAHLVARGEAAEEARAHGE